MSPRRARSTIRCAVRSSSQKCTAVTIAAAATSALRIDQRTRQRLVGGERLDHLARGQRLRQPGGRSQQPEHGRQHERAAVGADMHEQRAHPRLKLMATEERQWTDAERWYRERYSATPERPRRLHDDVG